MVFSCMSMQRDYLLESVKANDVNQAEMWLSFLNFDLDDPVDENGNTYLIYATSYNRPEIVRLLLKFGAKSHKENNFGKSAIEHAIHFNINPVKDIFSENELICLEPLELSENENE